MRSSGFNLNFTDKVILIHVGYQNFFIRAQHLFVIMKESVYYIQRGIVVTVTYLS